MVDYLCGDGPEEKLLELARGSAWNTAWSNWAIGCVKMSKKEYSAASVNFREFNRAGAITIPGNYWLPIWAERLEKDPTWPPWIKNPKK